MATVKTTGMLALVCALATVGIVATVTRHALMAPAAESPAPQQLATRQPLGAPQPLATRRLTMPVQGFDPRKLQDNFNDMRAGVRRHEALDIMAARGTPVIAAYDGVITKLFRSLAGGITIYQSDPSRGFIYYYAHLDRYRDGLKEGQTVKRGEVIGYVGSTGNAPANAPHLHFTMFELDPERKWWRGKAVNPYPYLAAR